MNNGKIDWKNYLLKNWSLVEEGGELISENDFFFCLVFIDGDNVGDTTAGAVTVHGQSQSWWRDGTETLAKTAKGGVLQDKIRLITAGTRVEAVKTFNSPARPLRNQLTVDDELLRLLPGHPPAKLGVHKPVNI